MGYSNWTKTHKDAIQATSAIVTAIGIVIGGLGLWISTASLDIASSALEESKKATEAQTFFDIQRSGLEFSLDTFDDAHFQAYYWNGLESIPVEHYWRVRWKFSNVLTAYNIISFQRKHGYINDTAWDLYSQEFCLAMQTKGADDYFAHYPIEQINFDVEFKSLITACRSSP